MPERWHAFSTVNQARPQTIKIDRFGIYAGEAMICILEKQFGDIFYDYIRARWMKFTISTQGNE